MKFAVIRDDDLNFFTTQKQFNKSYQAIVKQFPVSFAVIPMVHVNFNNNYFDDDHLSRTEKIRNIDANELMISIRELSNYFLKYHSILNNEELVRLLQSESNIKLEFMMHGITHKYFSSGAEFKTLEVRLHDLMLSKKLLEKGLNTKISFFVPPSNSLSSKNLFTITKSGLNILKSGSFNGDSIFSRIIINYYKIPKLIRKLKSKLITNYNYLDYFKINGTICISSGSYIKDEYFLDYFNRNGLKNGDPVIISTHYTSMLDEEYRLSFTKFIKKLRSEGYEFVTISELVSKMELM